MPFSALRRGTPEGVYKELVRMHRSEGLSFRNVTTINLDEYAGLSPEDKTAIIII